MSKAMMCNADAALIGTRDSLKKQNAGSDIETAIILNCRFWNGKPRDDHACKHCLRSPTHALSERAWTFPDGSELRINLVFEALSPAALVKRPKLKFDTQERCTWITDEEILDDDQAES